MTSLTNIIVAIACFSFVIQAYKLKDMVNEAASEMESEIARRMERGQQSNIFHKRKFTKQSLAMQTRNMLYKKIKDKLLVAGESEERATEEASRGVLYADTTVVLKAGGQGAFTTKIKLVHDMCDDVAERTDCKLDEKFRSIDGRCNNPLPGKELLGAMSTAFRRDVAAVSYDPTAIRTSVVPTYDTFGYFTPSCSKYPRKMPTSLPSARLVSTNFHGDENSTDTTATHMLTQFAQFLDHDLTLAPEIIVSTEEECCNLYAPPPADCFPIIVPFNDPFYSRTNPPVNCLPLHRSVLFCEGAKRGRKEQVNAVTHFLDASNVYGSDEEVENSLRQRRNGLLKISSNNLLPKIDGAFKGGDERAREMPGLTAMHTVWLREHNRIARQIFTLKPDWTNEQIFQEARRILIALMQRVTYGEYLPVLLGPSTTSNPKNRLDLPIDGTKYDPTIDPSISNGFATAAYRFGHSMIQGLIQTYAPPNGRFVKDYLVRNNFFNDTNYVDTNGAGMEKLLKGLAIQPAQTCDPYITSEVSNFLFASEGSDHGEDLIARNIQRGRDHQLAPYVEYFFKFANDSTNIECWTQRPEDIPEDKWKKLMTVYNDPRDIDLFTGGLLEVPHGDGLTGKTFQKMKVDQFARLRDGDRYFFTHTGEAGSFTRNQRKAILRRTFGDILCDNTKIAELQKNVFRNPDDLDNPLTKCSGRENFDVSIFLEEPGEVKLEVSGVVALEEA